MNDAEDQLAQRLAVDLEEIFGAAIEVEEVTIAGEGPARITVACRAHGAVHAIAADGDSVIDATSGILRAAAELRLTSAFRELIG
jgi:hypothetical protein